MHADSACTGATDSLQRQGATVPPDSVLYLFGTTSFTYLGSTVTETRNKTDTVCMPIPRPPAPQIVFNATGQHYRQTTSFTYFGKHLSDAMDRRIRARGISFKRYTRELYDRPKASLLPLKARMVRPKVVEALLYECAIWFPPKGHYTKLRKTHHRMLLRILGAWCKSSNKRILSFKDALQRTECEGTETTMHTRRLLCRGRCSAWVTTAYPRGSCRESWRTRETVGRGGGRKMDGLCGRGSPAIWHHGGLEHRHT